MTTERNPIPDEVAARVVEMYVNEGAKLKEITEETGVPRSSIYWTLQKQGVDPQRQGTRRAAPDRAAVQESLTWAMERIEALAAENGQLRSENERLRTQWEGALQLGLRGGE